MTSAADTTRQDAQPKKKFWTTRLWKTKEQDEAGAKSLFVFPAELIRVFYGWTLIIMCGLNLIWSFVDWGGALDNDEMTELYHAGRRADFVVACKNDLHDYKACETLAVAKYGVRQ